MAALFGFFLFFVLSGGLVLFIVGIIAFGLHQTHKRVAEWDEAARQLGLQLEGPERLSIFGLRSKYRRMVGDWNGVPVSVRIRIVSSGSGNNRSTHYYTRVEATITPSLELGLNLRNKGFFGKLFGTTSQVDLPDPRLADAFLASAREHAHTARVLGLPYVLEGLHHLASAGLSTSITDGAVWLEREEVQRQPGVLGWRLDATADIARRLVAARRETGDSAREKALMEAWSTVGAELGLDHEPSKKMLSGRLHGMYVEVEAGVTQRKDWTVFRVRYDRALGVGLRLSRQGSLAAVGRMLGFQDIRVGDPAFDDRFIVKGQPEDAVRSLLTDELRAHLVELSARATEVAVEDDHLDVRLDWWVADPEAVRWGAHAVAKTGAALVGVSAVPVGPYRAAR